MCDSTRSSFFVAKVMEQSTAEPSHSPAPSLLLEPTLNTYYYVQRADESWHVAEVIQKREVDIDNEKKKEFYVHYKDCKKTVRQPNRTNVYVPC